MMTLNILYCWAKKYAPLLLFFFLLELKIVPLLILFTCRLWVSPQKSSVKCFINFFIWSQLLAHFQAYFIFPNTCPVETPDFLLKQDFGALQAYSTAIAWILPFCHALENFCHLSAVLHLLFPGSQFWVGLFPRFDRSHPQRASWFKVQESQIFYTLKV